MGDSDPGFGACGSEGRGQQAGGTLRLDLAEDAVNLVGCQHRGVAWS